jgi:uncharacterized membrane protein YfcA
MPYSLQQLVIATLVVSFGSVLQGTVGFASGLMGVPVLVLCGFSLLDATVINFVSSSVQNAAGAVQLWRHLEPRDVLWPSVLRMIGLPLGVYVLSVTNGLDHHVVNQIVGCVLLGSVVLLAGSRVEPRERVNAGWTLAAFLSSGFLTGFASIGGAPMVMYVNSLTWSAAKSRGFLFFCSAALIPLMALLLLWRFGHEATAPALVALLAMPLVFIGLGTGLKLGQRLDKARFRRLTYALLTLIAIAAIIGPAVFNRR